MGLSLIQKQGDESSHSREGRPSENAGGTGALQYLDSFSDARQSVEVHWYPYFLNDWIPRPLPQSLRIHRSPTLSLLRTRTAQRYNRNDLLLVSSQGPEVRGPEVPS
jgi:hypothetical protein